MQINKSDRNDAIGIRLHHADGTWLRKCMSRISTATRSGRYWPAGRCLVKIKRDLESHVRGLLKNLGLIGRAKFNVFAVRAEALIEGRHELTVAIRPLLEARDAV